MSEPTTRRIDEAFAAVPRHHFLPPDQRQSAALDQALGIGFGVTNSQPTTVRNMLVLLDPQPGDRVLDLGSGSGWTTALLARLVGPAGTVVGVERIPDLVRSSRAALAAIVPDEKHLESEGSGAVGEGRSPFSGVTVHQAEPGVLGWPADAPYDRILVSAEATRLPDALVAQLRVGGVLVIPVAGVMHRVVATDEGAAVERHGHYQFVPLIED